VRGKAKNRCSCRFFLQKYIFSKNWPLVPGNGGVTLFCQHPGDDDRNGDGEDGQRPDVLGRAVAEIPGLKQEQPFASGLSEQLKKD
jgi:hypothetical protein